MIYGQISGQKEMIARFAALPGKVKAQADETVNRLGFQLWRDVQLNYLTGQVLHVRTDKLRGSIAKNHPQTRTRFESTPTAAYAYVGTNVEYAAVHEYGFDGMVTVREHARRIFPRTKGGKRKRVKDADVPRGFVRSFQRHMRMPKRAYLAPAFAAFKPKVLDAFNRMLSAVVKDGLTR